MKRKGKLLNKKKNIQKNFIYSTHTTSILFAAQSTILNRCVRFEIKKIYIYIDAQNSISRFSHKYKTHLNFHHAQSTATTQRIFFQILYCRSFSSSSCFYSLLLLDKSVCINFRVEFIIKEIRAFIPGNYIVLWLSLKKILIHEHLYYYFHTTK